MTVPHHSEPAREAVKQRWALARRIYEARYPVRGAGLPAAHWDAMSKAERTPWLACADALSASPAPAAGGLEAVIEGARSQAEMLLLAIMAGDPASELRIRVDDIIAALASPAARKRWPLAESPGDFAERLERAYREFNGDMLAAVRNCLIENPAAQRGRDEP